MKKMIGTVPAIRAFPPPHPSTRCPVWVNEDRNHLWGFVIRRGRCDVEPALRAVGALLRLLLDPRKEPVRALHVGEARRRGPSLSVPVGGVLLDHRILGD